MKNEEIIQNAVEYCATNVFDYVFKHPETHDHLGTILGYICEHMFCLFCGADIEEYKEQHKHLAKFLEWAHEDMLRCQTDEQRNCDA